MFAYVKTKTQTSFAVTAKLISAFCFHYRDSTITLLLKSKVSCFYQSLVTQYRPVCVGPYPEDRFSHVAAYFETVNEPYSREKNTWGLL